MLSSFIRRDAAHAQVEDRLPSERTADEPLRLEELDCASGVHASDDLPHFYDEDAFRYFLEVERKRAELSARPFLLLLVDLKKQMDADPAADASAFQLVLPELAACLRETDFLGWYHEGRIAGAVLTQHAEGEGASMTDAVCDRITSAVTSSLPPDVAGRVQIRVYRLPTNVREQS